MQTDRQKDASLLKVHFKHFVEEKIKEVVVKFDKAINTNLVTDS